MHQNGIYKVYFTILKYLLYILKAEGIKNSGYFIPTEFTDNSELKHCYKCTPHEKAQLKISYQT